VIRDSLRCSGPERTRRLAILVLIVAVPYVPGGVALAMLLTGAD
jgi:hypothetical protein